MGWNSEFNMEDNSHPSNVEDCSLQNLLNRLGLGNFDALQISAPVNLDNIKASVDEILQTVPVQHKDHHRRYVGLGLQYSDPADLYYSGVNSLATSDCNFKFYTKWNSCGERLRPYLADYTFLGLSRGRILVMEPGFCLKEHIDSVNLFRLHLVLQSHPKCRFVINKKTYNFLESPKPYIINTGRPHSVQNMSEQHRIHIVFDLVPNFYLYQLICRIDSLDDQEKKEALFSRLVQYSVSLDFKCEDCSSLNANNIIFRNEYPELNKVLDSDNMINLCSPCFLAKMKKYDGIFKTKAT